MGDAAVAADVPGGLHHHVPGVFDGCIVNLWLGWDVWDYSGMPGNILGQVCPRYFLLWLPVSLAGILLDDWLRYWWWGEERPHYRLL